MRTGERRTSRRTEGKAAKGKVRKRGRIMLMKERERNVGIMNEGKRKCGQGEGSMHEIEEYMYVRGHGEKEGSETERGGEGTVPFPLHKAYEGAPYAR